MTISESTSSTADSDAQATSAAEDELSTRFHSELIPLLEPLYRHAMRMTRNHADAEDLVQDTMVNAYANLGSFKQGTNLQGWLFRIMTNTYINDYRKKRRQPTYYPTGLITEALLATAAHHWPAGPRSAEEQALNMLGDSSFHAAMCALPEQFRLAVYYADVEGLRSREIADLMHTPVGTVMSRLHRGRRLLADVAEQRGYASVEGRVTAIAACRTCGAQPLEHARFCHGCGSSVEDAGIRAEYKQVTVLFADVVHSMDLASAVGAERLREIMADLTDRCARVVQRYGSTVAQFTGDGIMAVFGAPVALEDHAIRACLAALGVQEEAKRLAVEVHDRDGVELQLRVGLNSGEVTAGGFGSGRFGYAAVGEQVGLAQRIESVAPPGGVMLSASTARLVEGAAILGEPELVRIKGADEPVAARRLLGMRERHRADGRAESPLVGRRWEMSAVESLLERAIDGHGAVVGVVGAPGIGKSRLMREVAAIARRRNVEVFTTFCESHATDVSFRVVARLLRTATGVEGLEAEAARAQVRTRVRDADPEDLALLDDLLGIADPEVELPKIDPDARRRRLTALVNAATLARESPRVYIIEDAHWIDEVSESMLAAFLTVIPQTPSLVLVTYRPEYRGALTRVADAHTVALAPLNDSETTALVCELLGDDPSVGELSHKIAERAAGNPFFAEEMVRELAECGVLQGQTGAYVSTADVSAATVPATLQATIAARIDRLDPKAKRTLSAATVIGSRFGLNLLTVLEAEPVVDDLVAAQLIDQVSFTRQPEYVFHHPLIRTVAYESQLKSDRAELHRRLADAIQEHDPESLEENAALIAEHLEAAGDLHAAYGWHMRAATWATNRDIGAARLSWERAQRIADTLPAEDPNRAAMRIAPRTMLCGIAWRVHENVAGERFDELRQLCAAAGDKASLAIAMAGLVMDHAYRGQVREASRLASEAMALIESLGDPTLTVGLSFPAIYAKGKLANIPRRSAGHSGSSTWPTVTRLKATSFSGPRWRSPSLRGVLPVIFWVVLDGATTCGRAWPWPAAPIPCPTPRSSATSTSGGYRMVCWLPIIGRCARARMPYGWPNDPVMIKRCRAPGWRWALHWCTAQPLRSMTVDTDAT
jgi:RNA polymerase sigma-70 factor (TIGR02947 family)